MPNSKKQKLYCYVDETGQDTRGDLFLVCVVITDQAVEQLKKSLEEAENKSGKGSRKWFNTNDRIRRAYVEALINISELQGQVTYSIYRNTQEYQHLTALTAAKAILSKAAGPYEAVVMIDGLRKAEQRAVGSELRRLRIRIRKVRGADDQRDSLIRLADGIAGFIRDAMEGKIVFQQLYESAKSKGIIQETK